MALVLPLLIFGGLYYPLLGYAILACMFVAVVIAPFNGRYWCGRLCPRGLFFDEFIRSVSLNGKLPPLYKRTAFRLLWMAILMTVMAVQFILSKGDLHLFGWGLLMILIVTTVIGIILGIGQQARAWCLFCPIGTMSSWLGKNKRPVEIESASCTDCALCLKNCPMGIHAGGYKNLGRVADGDCTKCGTCVSVCPPKALRL